MTASKDTTDAEDRARAARQEIAPIVRARGSARRALLLYGLAGVILLGQQPYRRMGEQDRYADLATDLVQLSLVMDLAMIGCLLVAGLSAAGALWFAADLPPTSRIRIGAQPARVCAWVLAGAVVVAIGMDVAENVRLWNDDPAGLDTGLLTTLVQVAGVPTVASALGALAVAWRRQREARLRLRPADATQSAERSAAQQKDVTRPALVVACSGGGLRSASFGLGALQELQATGKLTRTTPVYAVSGGSYIASAFASMREGQQDKDVLFPGSAAERRLRNNTRYLIPSSAHLVWGAISLLWGVVVSLLLAAMLLRLLALFIAGYVREDGVLAALPTSAPEAALPGDIWSAYHLIWLVPLGLAGACIVGYFAWDAFFRPKPARELLRTGARLGLAAGCTAVLLLVAAPVTAGSLARMSQENRPTATAATVISGLGLTTPGGCRAALRESFVRSVDVATRAADGEGRGFGACGITGTAYAGDLPLTGATTDEIDARAKDVAGVDNYVSSNRLPGQVATLAALIAAVAALAKGASGVLGRPKEKAAPLPPRRLGRFLRATRAGLVARLRHTVLPWIATALVALIGAVLLMRWIWDLAVSPAPGAFALAQVLVPLAVLAGLAVITNANRTTLHTFYRERLSQAFATRMDGDRPAPRAYSEPWQLSSLGDIDLNICAAVSCSEREVVPPGRECTSFVFSSGRTGMTDPWLPGALGRSAATTAYELFSPRIVTVPAAVAISGAAVSPVTGRQGRSKPFRLLLAMANIRLGVWLRNPALLDAAAEPAFLGWLNRRVTSPRVWWVFREAFGRTSLDDAWLYTTDGGHYENLGLVEALRRRPEKIIVLDASADGENTFAALGTAMSTARMDLGVEITARPGDLPCQGEDGYAPTSTVRLTAKWPDSDETTEILLGKLILTDRLPWDAHSYALQHPEYPLLSTGQQLYGEFDFEAYRVLGREVGQRLVKLLDGKKVTRAPSGGTQMVDQGGPPASEARANSVDVRRSKAER